MNEGNPTSDNKSGTKVYSTFEVATKAIPDHQLYDVCRVVSEGFKFYILVDDLDGNKFWSQFDGVHKEEAINVNKTFKAGQQKYRDDPITVEDVENIRNIMTAVATLSVLFEYDDDQIATLTFNAVVKFAFDMYRRDKKCPEKALKDIPEDDPELGAYIAKVTFVFEEYRNLVTSVKESVDQATKEATKLPEEESNESIVNS